MPVADVCRQMGIAEATAYAWKRNCGNLGVLELRELRQRQGIQALPRTGWVISEPNAGRWPCLPRPDSTRETPDQ